MKAHTNKPQGRMGNVKKSLFTLQPAAVGGKENLVGGRRTVNDVRTKDVDNIESFKPPVQPNRIVAEDLTSKVGPGVKYWQELAERRRLALEETLEENKMLHEKIMLLEEENTTLRNIINDSADIINFVHEAVMEQYPEATEENTAVVK